MKFNKDDLFYFCSMVEFVARITKNHRNYIISKMSDEQILHELDVASVNHCLSFEQVCDEWIDTYHIENGKYDSVVDCKYKVPSYTAIGKVYQRLILDTLTSENQLVQHIRKIFNSFIIDEITWFNSNVYYSNPDYLRCSYLEGKLLN